MAGSARGGIFYLKVNGIQYDAKGEFTYNFGSEKRKGIAGGDRVHGYSTEVQIPFVEGKITDSGTLDVKSFTMIKGATVTLELANGKIAILKDAWYANEGTVSTAEGEIGCRFEGMDSEEIL